MVARLTSYKRDAVREVMRDLQLDEYENKASYTIKRREYRVCFINPLWHIEIHMKFIISKIARRPVPMTALNISSNNILRLERQKPRRYRRQLVKAAVAY